MPHLWCKPATNNDVPSPPHHRLWPWIKRCILPLDFWCLIYQQHSQKSGNYHTCCCIWRKGEVIEAHRSEVITDGLVAKTQKFWSLVYNLPLSFVKPDTFISPAQSPPKVQSDWLWWRLNEVSASPTTDWRYVKYNLQKRKLPGRTAAYCFLEWRI